MLRHLVELFDCDSGQDEATFNAVSNMISVMLGALSADAFDSCIDACEGRFFIKQGTDIDVWHKILECAY